MHIGPWTARRPPHSLKGKIVCMRLDGLRQQVRLAGPSCWPCSLFPLLSFYFHLFVSFMSAPSLLMSKRRRVFPHHKLFRNSPQHIASCAPPGCQGPNIPVYLWHVTHARIERLLRNTNWHLITQTCHVPHGLALLLAYPGIYSIIAGVLECSDYLDREDIWDGSVLDLALTTPGAQVSSRKGAARLYHVLQPVTGSGPEPDKGSQCKSPCRTCQYLPSNNFSPPKNFCIARPAL